MRTPTSPTVVLRPSVVTLAELRASGPAVESIASLVVDSAIAPDACGLPRSVAIAAFWPLVVAEEGDVARVVASRAVTVRRADEEGVSVGLRAQLVSGEAVRVHPMVAAVLADRRELHDVAVRGLWSDAAVADRAAMAPWRAPGDWPSKVTPGGRLGLAELTRDGAVDDARVYANDDELMAAWEQGLVAYDTLVPARIDGCRTTTTAGRVWLWRALPAGVRFAAVNWATEGTYLDPMIAGLDAEARWRMLAALDDAGSRWLARTGLSVGMDDLRPSDTRQAAIDEVLTRVQQVTADRVSGVITDAEQYNKVVDTWAGVADRCARRFPRPGDRDLLSSWMRAEVLSRHRARGLVALYGLVADSSGVIRERPVLGSAASGFDAHDTALMAMSDRAEAVRALARLEDTRKLLGAISHTLRKQRVTVDDCGTTRGASVCPWSPDERNHFGWRHEPGGRWTARRLLAEDVRWGDGALIAAAGTLLDTAALLVMRDAGVEEVRVRSPRACEVTDGVCARCWGLDDSGAFPPVGEPVGAKALQTLWRRLTETPLRTFHVGC